MSEVTELQHNSATLPDKVVQKGSGRNSGENSGQGTGTALTDKKQFVAFRLGEKLLMSPLNAISEVADPLPLTAVGGTQPWFQGLACKKGYLVPVSDLGAYAAQTPSSSKAGAKLLIITRDAETIGVLVDEVVGLTEVSPSGISAASQHESLSDSPLDQLVTQVISSSSGETAVVDLGLLLNQENFTQIGLNP